MNAFTVTIRRRLPYARVLAESFLANNPGSSFSVLVVDGSDSQSGEERFAITWPNQIGVSKPDLSKLAMLYDAPQLISALIAPYARLLRQSESKPHLYLGSGCKVFASLDQLGDQTSREGIVVVRRVKKPLPLDGFTPSQEELSRAGLIDDGFMGLGPSAQGFLDWWASASGVEGALVGRSDGDVEPAVGLPPLAEVASLYPHRTADEPGACVSFWNVHDRLIEASSNGGFTIESDPLLFFHFDGFTPESRHLLSAGQGQRPRVLLSERPDLRELVETYAVELMEAGFEEARKISYAFDELAPGTAVDRRMRSIYRKALLATREGAEQPPDPFDPEGPEAFIDWLNSPDEAGRAPFVPRYLFALWIERLDLQSAFPGIAKADAGRFLDWVVDHGAQEADIPAELVAPARPSPRAAGHQPWRLETRGEGFFRRAKLPDGLNVAGYLQAELGVGEMARLVLSGVQKSEVPHSTYSYRANMSRQSHPFEGADGEFAFNTTLVCVNADELKPFFRDIGKDLTAGRYAIGLCWWELDHIPLSMAANFELLDEIWAGSEHVARAVGSVTKRSVHLVPIPIRLIEAPKRSRAELGLSERFTFLFTFDFLSVIERKNPVGLINAFCRAFREGEGPELLIKSINGAKDIWSLEQLKVAAQGRTDVKIVDGYLPANDKDALLASCDCYVSLHRAEGYGLGMAEAMAMGKPVIATGYSGNLAFMNHENSYLVGYNLGPVPQDAGPYPQGAHWAEPDLEEASSLMRRVFENQDEAAQKGERGHRDAVEIHTPERTAVFIAARLEQIRRNRARIERREMVPRLAKALPRRLGLRRPQGSRQARTEDR